MEPKGLQTPIVQEAIPFVVGGGVLTLGLLAAGWQGGAVLAFLFTVGLAAFFRNPRRVPPSDRRAIVSPADGKIVSIEAPYREELFPEGVTLVSIFMSLGSVHVNRVPVSGRVQEIFYRPGRFLPAFREGAVGQNERNLLVLTTEGGERVGIAQVAGFLARRIRCYLQPGDAVEVGERFGLIRFGSRVDLFLPKSVRVTVQGGERVRGGETILGRFERGGGEE